ncbi:hypothetical protein NC651_000680 [Populus alba x Populus x berolinensis]|nr:hypothetical protein NC651_000680 [Populus alba x Populus x berolinensis]
MSFSNDMDDEYEKLLRRLNPPRVVIDNKACKNATVIRVHSASKHGTLLCGILIHVQILIHIKSQPIHIKSQPCIEEKQSCVVVAEKLRRM